MGLRARLRGQLLTLGVPNDLLGGLAFVVLGAVALVAEFIELSRAIDSSDWPPVQGEIEETGVVTELSSGSLSYAPVVRYHYRVGDRQYLSDRVAFGGVVSSSFRWLASSAAERFGRQKQVSVYVSPKDPTLCVLEPGVHWTCWFVITIGAIFFGVGLQTLLAHFGLVAHGWVTTWKIG